MSLGTSVPLGASVAPGAPGAEVVDAECWRALGRAGFFAVLLPEASGGLGLGLPEAVLLFEEAGRALLPGPLVGTALAAGLVPGAAEGEAMVGALDARHPLLEYPGVCRAALVLDGATTRLLDTGELARCATPLDSLDPLTPLASLPGPLPARHPPGRPPGASRLRQEATLLTAALQLGSAARSVETAVAHARGRTQFGRPIGAFQAVQHLCAGMLERLEPARCAVYAAAVTGTAEESAAAKLLADEAAIHNARDCLQVHGGTGFTWESEVHLHLKRAWVRAAQWTTAQEAEELLAAELLTPETDWPRNS
ncbi:acyl-CoA dehydrogenase family protein [Streptomyces palmae]|uniref:acyl-CoA dehydrogenase family protein n=1 Tax=Streptomyces palmae TaxID=1701085 RepID=UPI003CC91879